MRKSPVLTLVICFLFFLQACTNSAGPRISSPVREESRSGDQNALIADHTSVAKFDSIDDVEVQGASGIMILFKHASTGARISQLGLEYMQGTGTQMNADGLALYPTYKYDRRNWIWQEWRYDGLHMEKNLFTKVIDKITGENAMSRIKMKEFVTDVTREHQNYDVMGMKFCYLDWKGLDWKVYRNMMLQLEVNYPDTRFIWATAAIQHSWDAPQSPAGAFQSLSAFNSKIREYARANNKPLFDIADIESHRADGSPCTDVAGREVLCPEYHADELGHPNLEGSIRLAKGFWRLTSFLGEKNFTNKLR